MTDMNFSSAVAAYKATARQAGDIAPAVSAQSQQGGQESSFAGMVRGVLETSVDTLHQGEKMTIAAIAGEADTRDVVMAVNNAEMTLQTVVRVRDKVINAYDTIMRMPL